MNVQNEMYKVKINGVKNAQICINRSELFVCDIWLL